MLVLALVALVACEQVDALGGGSGGKPEYLDPPEQQWQAGVFCNVYNKSPLRYRTEFVGWLRAWPCLRAAPDITNHSRLFDNSYKSTSGRYVCHRDGWVPLSMVAGYHGRWVYQPRGKQWKL